MEDKYTKVYVREELGTGIVKEKEVWVRFEEARENISQIRQALLSELRSKVRDLKWYIDRADDYCAQVEEKSRKDIWNEDNPLIAYDEVMQLINDLSKGDKK